MKISLLAPRGSNVDAIRSMLKTELSVESRNIQDKSTRKAVMSGLRKILTYLTNHPAHATTDGIALFTDGDEFIVQEYNGI